MLSPYELQVFLAAAEAENFSAAARKLHLTQPAVSQQIQALEKRLELELFHRDGKRITLTEDGQAFVPMARAGESFGAHRRDNGHAPWPGGGASHDWLHQHAGQIYIALASRFIL